MTKQIFGLECPACGAQRAFVAIVNGKVVESLLYFPALIPAIVTACFYKKPKIFLTLLFIVVGLIVVGFFTRNFML